MSRSKDRRAPVLGRGFLSSLHLACAMAAAVGLCLHAAAAGPNVGATDPVLVARAEKIVTSVLPRDAEKARRVRDVVARQYAELRVVHAARDAALQAAQELAGGDDTARERLVKHARDAARARQADLHYAFLGQLAAELTPDQIEQVKDGITYGVVPLTFRAYQDLLPELTSSQKAQIRAWLVEAREHAMDAGSAQEKHGWFGKYKGKINNLLSAAGYDLKQAERDLAVRRQAAVRAEN